VFFFARQPFGGTGGFFILEPLVRVESLYYTYHDGSGKSIPAINGVDLIINEGEFICIIGANGSGKSTLARHFNGLLQPTQGNVFVNGKNTRDRGSWRELRRTIGMVFQHPESQAVATTVEEDVSFGPENTGVPSDEIRKRVDMALEAVGLFNLSQRAPHHLSGGQKQRLALAGVLALRPRAIILDEATSMLDPSGRRGFRKIVQRLHAEGVTILMITQDMDEAAMADRVVVLSGGKVCRDDAARKVMVDGDFLQTMGLDTPIITRLAHELHKHHPDFPENILSVDEIVEAVIARSGVVSGKINESTRLQSYAGIQNDNLAEDSMLRAEHGKPAYIEALDLKYAYMRGTPLETIALRGATIKVYEGEIAGIIGATGSGKSTLLQHMNGLLTPQSGELRIANQVISGINLDLRIIRQQVALLFQHSEDQFFERYVADDIAYGPINLGLSMQEVRQRVEKAMNAVGLPVDVFRDRSIYSLSGGEGRRAALAGVLALQPKVLVLDEPSAGLDPSGRQELRGLLQSWQTQDERSIIWASHSMDEIAQVAGRITVMADGRIVRDDTPRQVFARADELASSGLDLPQIVQVMHGVTATGLMAPVGIFTIDEAVPALIHLIA
jgi:energy-coupling factor transport system ATP-binding protein